MYCVIVNGGRVCVGSWGAPDNRQKRAGNVRFSRIKKNTKIQNNKRKMRLCQLHPSGWTNFSFENLLLKRNKLLPSLTVPPGDTQHSDGGGGKGIKAGRLDKLQRNVSKVD
jgi:hypothetical protein